MELKWTIIDSSERHKVMRAKVIGGWLVRFMGNVAHVRPHMIGKTFATEANIYSNIDYHHDYRNSITFLPDPNHEWDNWVMQQKILGVDND